MYMGASGGAGGKVLTCHAGDVKNPRFDPMVGRRHGNPAPVLLPGESWTEGPGRLQSMGSHGTGHNLAAT